MILNNNSEKYMKLLLIIKKLLGIKNSKVIEKKTIISKPFDIVEFNNWFKNDYRGYGGIGASGIFLRLDKLSPNMVKDYLEYINEDTSHENVYHHYLIIRNDWLDRLNS
jgi:hypothetical protein